MIEQPCKPPISPVDERGIGSKKPHKARRMEGVENSVCEKSFCEATSSGGLSRGVDFGACCVGTCSTVNDNMCLLVP